jgi:hypothetical protein
MQTRPYRFVVAGFLALTGCLENQLLEDTDMAMGNQNVFSYYVQKFNADSSITLQPEDFALDDITAIAIGNRSSWDQVAIFATDGPYKTQPLIVGARQPFIGSFPNKMRIQGMAKYPTLASDILADNSFELEVKFYTGWTPPNLPTRRDVMRRNFSLSAPVTTDQFFVFNTTGRDWVNIAYRVTTAAASGANIVIWGLRYIKLPNDTWFAAREQLDTNAVAAATTEEYIFPLASTTHLDRKWDGIEIDVDVTAGTVSDFYGSLIAGDD